MNNEEIRKKEEIESALAAMIDGDFLETSKHLLAASSATAASALPNFWERRRTLSGGFQPGTETPTRKQEFRQ